ncbi:hypothetical protein NHX12_009454 [Muraenolepis orangiensis]|uniref:C2H2-type domain-containing protein n=1 Tax=Muraenolepis orangiensis TaxID=630683 RepID=A0A9Q0DH87_9TELE|nr:hypothetical protein NHX12_009454 [Muraenolepis orangiensis]
MKENETATRSINILPIPFLFQHVTVHRRDQGTPKPLHGRDPGLFLCPFCSATHYKPTQYPQIMAHLASHKWKAIQHGDYIIYSCKLGCGGKPVHFHCYQCPRFYRTKSELLKHLKSHPTLEGQPPPPQGVHPPTGPPPPTGPHVQAIGPPTPLPHLKSELTVDDQPRAEPPPTQPPPPTEPAAITLEPPAALAEPPTPLQPRAEQPAPPQPRVEPATPSHPPSVSGTPKPLRWRDPGLFLCPFCSATHYKPTQYPQIMAHLASHKWKAIQHGDYIIYSCKLGCDGKSVHFHCCQCPRCYCNKGELLKHLKSHSTPEGQPLPPEGLPPPTEPPPLTGPPPPAGPHHVTVHRRDEATPGPLRWRDPGLFLCPFCSATHYKPTQYPQIMAHLASHKWKAIQHGDYVIYSCKLGCEGKSVHFHCCQCPRSYPSKKELLKHLKFHPTPEGPPPPQRVLLGPAELPIPPQPQPPPPPTQPQPAAEPATPPQLEALPPKPRTSVRTKRKSVQCSHCGLSVNGNNMKKHVVRKHSAQPPRYAITTGHHLPSQCVDRNNGVYAVAKSFMGPRVPVHVAKNTGCDMDRCSGRADPGSPKGAAPIPPRCAHVKSLDYCWSDAPHHDPSEEALGRMVDQRWLGDAARSQCLARQKRAESDGAPLVSRVTLGGPQHMHYVSVYEPGPGRYSRTGRLIVRYDSRGRTWRCPCCRSAATAECPHKSVAKWCLFQAAGHLFAGPSSPGPDEEMPSQE